MHASDTIENNYVLWLTNTTRANNVTLPPGIHSSTPKFNRFIFSLLNRS